MSKINAYRESKNNANEIKQIIDQIKNKKIKGKINCSVLENSHVVYFIFESIDDCGNARRTVNRFLCECIASACGELINEILNRAITIAYCKKEAALVATREELKDILKEIEDHNDECN